MWEGPQTLKKKCGDTVQCKCKVVPVETSSGLVNIMICLLANRLLYKSRLHAQARLLVAYLLKYSLAFGMFVEM